MEYNIMLKINNSIVKKDWGFEYQVFNNQHLAIWFLKIEKDQETSMHLHATKNTGLIVLDGFAKISFLNNSINMKGLDKISVFARRFHSTKALSKNGVCLLEVEAPEDKTDLVRMSDKYGRQNKPYEGKENYTEITDNCLLLKEDEELYQHSNCQFVIENIKNKKQLIGRDFEEVFVILEGGIATKDNVCISCPGDVIASHNFDTLLKVFDITANTKVLSIRRHET